jgi:dTMP kinase
VLITFEGIDGCGKSTQVKLLAERLKAMGKTVFPLREPGGTELSEEVRSILLNKNFTYPLTKEAEFLLFAASRAQLVREIIKPALENKVIVILDRFIDSTIAYQGFGRDIELALIENVNTLATAGVDPDVTFLLDIPIEVALLRRKDSANDRIESEAEEFYKKVSEGYQYVAKEYKRIHTIDGTASVEEVQNAIWKIVEEKISK